MPETVQAVVTLRTQYRMCADIMAVANELTYEGQLRCGSPLVEQGMLSPTAAIPASLPGWLRQASTPCTRRQSSYFIATLHLLRLLTLALELSLLHLR